MNPRITRAINPPAGDQIDYPCSNLAGRPTDRLDAPCNIWPWVKIQIALPVNIPIPTNIGSLKSVANSPNPNKMRSQNGFDHHSQLDSCCPDLPWPEQRHLVILDVAVAQTTGINMGYTGKWKHGPKPANLRFAPPL